MLEQLLSLLGLGRVTLVDDSGDFQEVQFTEGSVGSARTRITDRIRRLTEFGFTSVPPLDSDAVVLRRNAERGKSLVLATSHRPSRPRGLKAGDTAVYDVRGAIIRLTADGIEIDAAGQAVTVTNATQVRCECDIYTTGDVISRADAVPVSLNALRDAYDLHDHPPVATGASWGSGPPDRQV